MKSGSGGGSEDDNVNGEDDADATKPNVETAIQQGGDGEVISCINTSSTATATAAAATEVGGEDEQQVRQGIMKIQQTREAMDDVREDTAQDEYNMKRAVSRQNRINSRSEEGKNEQHDDRNDVGVKKRRVAHRDGRFQTVGSDDSAAGVEGEEELEGEEEEGQNINIDEDNIDHSSVDSDAPGAFPVDGPNVSSSHSILASMISNTTASDGNATDTNLVDGGAPNSPAISLGYDDGNDNEVVADMVDEAEVVQYAEEAHCMNYLQKFRYVIILSGIVVIIAIVLLALDNEKVQQGDPRCDEWPLNEEMSIPLRCYCFNDTSSQALITETQEQMYLHTLDLMKQYNIIDSNWTIPTETFGNSNIQTTSNTGNESLYDSFNLGVCDPINQALLEVARKDFGLSGPPDAVIFPPDNVLRDWYVLKYLYIAMGGINWLRNDLWVSPIGDICHLHGVDCIFVNWPHILELSGNNLVGTIPDTISHLETIQILDLSDNPGITGTIPTSIFGMSSLETLDLSGCSLEGTTRVTESESPVAAGVTNFGLKSTL